MRPSTLVEIAGFAAISAAAWLLSPIFGLFTVGFCLLLVGYAFDDPAAVVALHRVTDPISQRHAARKAARQAKRATRKALRASKAV